MSLFGIPVEMLLDVEGLFIHLLNKMSVPHCCRSERLSL